MLLAAAETVQNRQKDALHHIIGAFNLFNLRDKQGKDEVQDHQTNGKSMLHVNMADIDILEDVFRSMDVQIATFVWGKQPFLKSRRLTESMLTSNKLEDLINDQPNLLHSCLHLVARASEECYSHFANLPFHLIHEQEQLISWLRLWLSNLNQFWKADGVAPRPRCTSAEERHLNLLKSQVLAILVTISNIKTPAQTNYDKYDREFEEILRAAEVVLGQTGAPEGTKSTTTLPPFSPSPGIIQPLFFLARKYRHSVYRRQAIALLRVSGIEGPFNGNLEAAVAERIVEIEEARPFKPTLTDGEILLTNDIPESRRISSCWRLSENDNNPSKKAIKLCRRKYPVRVPEGNWHDVDMEWEMWEEYFGFDVGKAGGFRIEPEFARGKQGNSKQWRALPQESFWAESVLLSMSRGVGLPGRTIDASAASQSHPPLNFGTMPAFAIAGAPSAKERVFRSSRVGV